MNAIVKIEPVNELPQSSIDRVIEMALQQDDIDLDRVERFLSLKREYEADEARKAYVAAMAQFKAEPLQIVKDKHVKFTTQKGVTEYDHATIGNVVGIVCAGLGSHGFSHRWDTKQDAGKITVTCIITHSKGHAESTTLTASPDDSGGKNGIQSIASTITYLQRYTLLAATGMATKDQQDDDGRVEQDESDEVRKIELAWIEQISNVDSLEKHAVTRQAIIDDYKGQSNVSEVIRKALMARKRELAGDAK